MTIPPKRFMAELQLAARRSVPGVVAASEGAAVASLPGTATVAVDNSEVLRAIAVIEAKLDRVLTVEQTDIAQIQLEISDISGRIKATNVEIAALRHPLAGEDKFQLASEELGAVVKATENATNAIMSCAEEVEDIVREVRAQMPDGYQSSRLGDIHETIMRIYEACNFQDLTGQRINKVVRALSFIEERVESMLSVWHKADLATMPLPPSIIKDDAGLALTGPAPTDPDHAAHQENISQSDIDALFD